MIVICMRRSFGKKEFVVVIEDTERNKFGVYWNTEVRNTEDWQKTDIKTFAFSLQSNGRCNGMNQFDINFWGLDYGFCLDEKLSFRLFGIGDDIFLAKKDLNEGWCRQRGFDYDDIDNELCGKYGKNDPFTIKRFIFIQMEYDEETRNLIEMGFGKCTPAVPQITGMCTPLLYITLLLTLTSPTRVRITSFFSVGMRLCSVEIPNLFCIKITVQKKTEDTIN